NQRTSWLSGPNSTTVLVTSALLTTIAKNTAVRVRFIMGSRRLCRTTGLVASASLAPHRGSTSIAQLSSRANRQMTEWNASEYNSRSALQKWLAGKSLAGLDVRGSERVLDVGCGDGKITAEIAERLPSGSVVGVDPSTGMITFAREHFLA